MTSPDATGPVPTGSNSFLLKGYEFFTDTSMVRGLRKGGREFTIAKSKRYFQYYESIREKRPKSIFEVGFFEGGSSVYLDLFFEPESLSCLDRTEKPLVDVEKYRTDAGRTESMRMFYGLDQGDTDRLRKIVADHHDGSLDLVIDDASHQYNLSRKTFSALFPFVRPGGLYVLEDFGWAHIPQFQGKDAVWADQPAMSNLVFELTMVAATNPGMVNSLYLDRAMCVVERGPQPHEGLFDPSDSYLARGRSLTPI